MHVLGRCDCPVELRPPLEVSAVAWPLLALPDPAALFPPLAVFAVAVPRSALAAAGGVLGRAVPPLFGGCDTCRRRAVRPGSCYLAAVETAAPFSTPVRSVVVASSSLGAPASAGARNAVEHVGVSAGTVVRAGNGDADLGEHLRRDILGAPGREPADAIPTLAANAAATTAAARRGRERARRMNDLLDEAMFRWTGVRGAAFMAATVSGARASSSLEASAAAATRSRTTRP